MNNHILCLCRKPAMSVAGQGKACGQGLGFVLTGGVRLWADVS